MSTEQHIYAGNCPDELDRMKRDPDCAGCRKLAPMAEQDERKEVDGKVLAAAVGMLALLVLAASASRSPPPKPKPKKYDWLDHLGGISLADKILGIK